MQGRRSAKLVLGALLLCALAAAEALAVAHWLDFESHTSAEPCKICVSVAGLGSAAPAKAPPPEPPAAAVPGSAGTHVAAGITGFRRPFARGPPHAS